MTVTLAHTEATADATEQTTRAGRRTLSTAVHVSEVLVVLAEDAQGATAKQIARRLGQSLSTTYYALQTLAEVGLVEPSPCAPGLYTLGPLIAQLYRGYVANQTLPERLSPVVASLRDQTAARSYLCAWSRGDLEVTHVVGRRGSAELQDVSAGFRGAAHALAPGKVLLATTHPKAWPEYLRRPHLETFTPATKDTPGALHLELRGVREQGFAIDVEEFRSNVCCLAYPVRDSAGRVLASVAISVTARRFRHQQDELREAVSTTAAEASALYARLDPLTAVLREAAGQQ